MKKAILNGKLIDASEAIISIADKGYFFDFAVYSSVKVIQGNIFFAEYHVDRLFESAQLLGLDHPFLARDVVVWMAALVQAEGLKDALLKIVLIGDPDEQNEQKLFIFAVSGLTYYPDKFYKRGVKVITYRGERRVPRAKSTELLMSLRGSGSKRA